jgi:hypothetical protein
MFLNARRSVFIVDYVLSYALAEPLHARPALSLLEEARMLEAVCPQVRVEYRGDSRSKFETPARFLRFLEHLGSQYLEVRVVGEPSPGVLEEFAAHLEEIAQQTGPVVPSRSFLALIGANV